MIRWKVHREWRDTLDSYSWVALSPSGLSGDVFPTWREAMDYADRMARTREYVLPRPSADGYITTTDEQVAWENTEIESNVKTSAWLEEPGTIGLSIGDCDHYMTTDGALSIALALAALAEKEGVK